MDGMTGNLVRQGVDPAEARRIAQNCAEKADRRGVVPAPQVPQKEDR